MISKNHLPQVFMIVMKDNPVSMYYRGRVEESWTRAGYKLEMFDAVTPETLHKQEPQFKFGIKKVGRGAPRELTDTEKAIWYSHRALWKLAASKRGPIIIIEHDAMLVEPIDPELFNRHKTISLCNANGKATPGGAYFLNKEVGDALYKGCNYVIDHNSDGLLYDVIQKYGIHKPEHCVQIVDKTIGKTIKHG